VSAVAVALSIPTGSRLRQDGGSPRLKTWGSSSQETSASAKAAAWWPPPQHRRPPPEPQGHVQTNVTSALIDPPGLSVGAGPVPAGLRACPQLSQQTAVVNLIRRNRSQTEEALLAMGDTPWCRTRGPTCHWQCDSPTCDQTCEPVCKQPKCEIRCSKCDDPCYECDRPLCSTTCDCPSDTAHCASCNTTCDDPVCHQHCPPTCHTVCAQPECEYHCKKPEDCPKPCCKMECESPQECGTEYDNELPPSQPGETVVGNFRGPVPKSYVLSQLAKAPGAC
jgi:hypothetical protein